MMTAVLNEFQFKNTLPKKGIPPVLQQDIEEDETVSVEVVIQDMHYAISKKRNGECVMTPLLKGVSAILPPGKMCAIMGASGSGKSTLLDLMAGRKVEGTWVGNILFNGRPRDKFFNRMSAYVMQDDVLIPQFTVHETLLYAARLRMNEGVTELARLERVRDMIEMLGLESCAETRVGDPMERGISGGQRKRVAVGVEIIGQPYLIFLDEPTSGLDAAVAFEVMSALRRVADQRRTVVSTIHHPSPELFGLFDQLLLLASGRCVYAGPACDALPYFTQHPLSFPYEEGTNPADFILEATSGGGGGGGG